MPNLPGTLQAALQTRLLPLCGDDLRVDQLDACPRPSFITTHTRRSTPTCGAARPAPLASSQRLLHVIDQHVQTLIELRHRAAHLGQALVALFYDLSQ